MNESHTFMKMALGNDYQRPFPMFEIIVVKYGFEQNLSWRLLEQVQDDIFIEEICLSKLWEICHILTKNNL